MITESKHNEKIPLTSVPLARDWSYSEPFWNLTHSLKGSTELLPAIYGMALEIKNRRKAGERNHKDEKIKQQTVTPNRCKLKIWGILENTLNKMRMKEQHTRT